MLKAVAAFFSWTLFAAYLGALFWLSARDSVPGAGWHVSDKLVHAVAYFGLCVVSRLAFGTVFSRRSVAILAAVLVTLLYGATDEWHQSTVPTRSPDFYDWVADAIGGVIGGVLFFVLERRRRVRAAVATKTARA